MGTKKKITVELECLRSATLKGCEFVKGEVYEFPEEVAADFRNARVQHGGKRLPVFASEVLEVDEGEGGDEGSDPAPAPEDDADDEPGPDVSGEAGAPTDAGEEGFPVYVPVGRWQLSNGDVVKGDRAAAEAAEEALKTEE